MEHKIRLILEVGEEGAEHAVLIGNELSSDGLGEQHFEIALIDVVHCGKVLVIVYLVKQVVA